MGQRVDIRSRLQGEVDKFVAEIGYPRPLTVCGPYYPYDDPDREEKYPDYDKPGCYVYADRTGKGKYVGVVIAEITEDKSDPEYEALAECHRVSTEEPTDAQGRKIEVRTLKRPRIRRPSRDFCSSYVNFYIANGGIIMPKFGDETADEAARQVIANAFPDRRVVQLGIDTIAKGGGGIHCITQQQPSGQKSVEWSGKSFRTESLPQTGTAFSK
jgi:hypothetical protein